MNEFEEDVEAVKKLHDGKVAYIAWSEESGGEVHRIWDDYFLFSIPLYGGEGNYKGHFNKRQIEEMVKLAHSWT